MLKNARVVGDIPILPVCWISDQADFVNIFATFSSSSHLDLLSVFAILNKLLYFKYDWNVPVFISAKFARTAALFQQSAALRLVSSHFSLCPLKSAIYPNSAVYNFNSFTAILRCFSSPKQSCKLRIVLANLVIAISV